MFSHAAFRMKGGVPRAVRMDLKSLNIFKALQHKMAWNSQRQAMLSSNIANANTPDYRPKDLKPVRFTQVLTRSTSLTLARTHPNHQKPPSQSDVAQEYTVRSAETKRNGNGVTVENELMKVAEAQLDYSLVTNLYRKHQNMLRTALGRSGR